MYLTEIILACLVIGLLGVGRSDGQDQFQTDVVVKLTCQDQVLKISDELQCEIVVKNRSSNVLYLVRDSRTQSSNSDQRQLGIGFDKQTTNFHYLAFPRLRRIEPKSYTKYKSIVPVADFPGIVSSSWSLIASVGVLYERDLSKTIAEYGGKRERISTNAFLSIQQIAYSNKVKLNIIR